MRVEPENKYEELLLNNWKKIGVGIFGLFLIFNSIQYFDIQVVPRYETTWTCDHDGKQLKATGEADIWKKVTGDHWLHGPILLEYDGQEQEWNAVAWNPDPEDCKPIVNIFFEDSDKKTTSGGSE